MPKKMLKPIPKFRSQAQESAFWATHDTTDFLDWSQAQVATFPHLKLSTQTISLRLPQGLLDDIKIMANQHDVPYQSLMKILLADAVARGRERNRPRTNRK